MNFQEAIKTTFSNYESLDDNKLLKAYLLLKDISKEVDLFTKLISEEINKREVTETNHYKVEYKSRNLFDKDKAWKELEEAGQLDNYIKPVLDEVKVKALFKLEGIYDNFTKQTKPTMSINRK